VSQWYSSVLPVRPQSPGIWHSLPVELCALRLGGAPGPSGTLFGQTAWRLLGRWPLHLELAPDCAYCPWKIQLLSNNCFSPLSLAVAGLEVKCEGHQRSHTGSPCFSRASHFFRSLLILFLVMTLLHSLGITLPQSCSLSHQMRFRQLPDMIWPIDLKIRPQSKKNALHWRFSTEFHIFKKNYRR
jgi:hypothetical protein